MGLLRLFTRTRRDRRQALAAWQAQTDAALAERRQARAQRAAAARAGQATRIHQAFARDRLLNEGVKF